jgi:hypothetical protein
MSVTGLEADARDPESDPPDPRAGGNNSDALLDVAVLVTAR